MVQSEKCEIIWSALANFPRRQKNTALTFIIKSVTIILYQVYVYPQEILRSQMSVYKPVQNYIIARNQTCAWDLSKFLPIGLAARNVVCPEMLSKQRY